MAQVKLIHWNEAEAIQMARDLEALGFDVDWRVPEGRQFFRETAKKSPKAILISLNRLPSQGRDLAIALRKDQATRHIPLLFIDGQSNHVTAIKEILPDATFATWAEMDEVIPDVIATEVRDPVVPESVFAGYKAKPLVSKLGIKESYLVCLQNSPAGFEFTLGELPPEVNLRYQLSPKADLVIFFAPWQSDLLASLDELVQLAEKAPVWIAWPKKTSGVESDLSETVVRNNALAAGLVDYKICAIDTTWSGLLFTKRKT